MKRSTFHDTWKEVYCSEYLPAYHGSYWRFAMHQTVRLSIPRDPLSRLDSYNRNSHNSNDRCCLVGGGVGGVVGGGGIGEGYSRNDRHGVMILNPFPYC